MFKKIVFFISVSICIILFAEIRINAATGKLTVTGTQNYSEVWDVLDLVNEYRAAENLPPLTMDSELLKAAMFRAAECSVHYDHTRPDGSKAFTVVEWRSVVGENIGAMNHIVDAAYITDGWMNSEGHRENIMSPDFKSIGIGIFEANGFQYWAQMFDGGEPRTVEKSTPVESVSYAITADESCISLKYTQDPNITYHGEPPFDRIIYTIGGIYNLNSGWDLVAVALDKASFTYHSSDPNVANVSDGIISLSNVGKTTVTVSLTDFPDKSAAYNVDVTEHEFTDWKTVKNPDCVNDGEMTAKCNYCDAAKSQPITATGEHIFDNGTTDGNLIIYRCRTPDCSESYTEEIPVVTTEEIIAPPETTEEVKIETTTAVPDDEVVIETTAETEITPQIPSEEIIEKAPEAPRGFTAEPWMFIVIMVSIFGVMVIGVVVYIRKIRKMR